MASKRLFEGSPSVYHWLFLWAGRFFQMQYITACVVGHDAESLINVEKVTFVTEIEDSVVGALFNALIVRLKSWNLINRVVFCSSAKKFQGKSLMQV